MTMGVKTVTSQTFSEVSLEVIKPNAVLLHCVPMANGYGLLAHRVPINCDAARGTRFVHSPISPADGSAVIVETGDLCAQIMLQSSGHLGHPVLFDQRKNAGRDGCDTGMQPENHPGLALDFLLAIP